MIRKNLLIASLVLAVAVVYAAAPQFRLFSTAEDMEKGASRGVSIDAFGALSLAPSTTPLRNVSIPMLWCVATDAQGNVLAGGGNPAQILSVNSAGAATALFTGEEVAVFAMQARGNEIFAATSPNGEVYRLDAQRKSHKFFKPEAKYIWALAAGNDGALYVATGSPAKLYRVDAAGKGAVIFECDEQHVRSLSMSSDNWLYAGSSGNGYVYRLRPDGGSVSVLYDAPMDEILQVLPAKDGVVYAAASGQAGGAPQGGPGQPSEAILADDDEALQEGQAVPARPEDEALSPLLQPGGAARAKSALYRISPSGHVKDLWSARSDRIYSAMLDKDGSLLVGTGDRGRLYRVNADLGRTLMVELDAPQLTALIKDGQDNVLLASSNPGTVTLLRNGVRSAGQYESDVIDAKVPSRWGAMSWEEQGNGAVKFATRSGNTGKPDKTWSDWAVVESKAGGSKAALAGGGSITSPPGRFLQWRVELSAKENSSPQVKRVNVSYLQNNVAPEITQITIHPPGDYFPDALKNNESDGQDETNGRAGNNQGPGRKTFQKGAQSISWQARDDNSDRLQFGVYYRMVGESSSAPLHMDSKEAERGWREIAGKLQSSAYSWDSQTMPDGEYQARIVANDAKSNSPATEASGEKISPPFIVDNTPPIVQRISARKDGAKIAVTFAVEDALSRLKEAWYAVDTGDWMLIYPRDGVIDQKQEEFAITLEPLKQRHILTVKVIDAAGNVGFGRTAIGE
jgi:hypothetical protein